MHNNQNTDYETMGQTDAYLDCKGLKCPMPIVQLSKAIKQLHSGQTITVEATDPAFNSDVHAWARAVGCELLEFKETPVLIAVLRKL